MGNKSQNPAAGTFTTAADNTPPTVVRVAPISLELVEVEFSEPVTEVSATNVLNYSIDKGISVSQAELNQTKTVVRLKTSQHSAGETYNISIQNIYDTAKQGNVIAANNNSYTISEICGQAVDDSSEYGPAPCFMCRINHKTRFFKAFLS